MKPRLLLCAFCALALAQEAPAPSAVEGVRGVRQEGSGKVKEIDPAAKTVAPTTVQGVDKVDGVKAPGGTKAVKQTPPPASVTEGAKATPPPPSKGLVGAEGVKPPEGVKGAGTKGTPPPPAPKGVEAVKGVKPPEAVKGAGTKATPPPPSAKGLEGVKGVKPPEGVKPAAGGIKPVEGVTGIGAGKQKNLEAALQIKPAGKPEPKKAKAAAALLGGPEPKGKPDKQDDRKLFEEIKKIPDNGS
ncbi:MAG: hypothetical protein EBR83_09585 [Verrucomicrobia bacterium]|nr:hypothetical protein [Verrucomicrobiota bacterium]